MFKFVGISSEHKYIPNHLLLSSERTERNRRNNWEYKNDDVTPYDEYSFNQFCTYAWIETDEVDVSNESDNQLPIAVIDYKPKYSKREQFVFEEPIWSWIEESRTEEQQRWISRNIDKLNDAFIAFAHID